MDKISRNYDHLFPQCKLEDLPLIYDDINDIGFNDQYMETWTHNECVGIMFFLMSNIMTLKDGSKATLPDDFRVITQLMKETTIKDNQMLVDTPTDTIRSMILFLSSNCKHAKISQNAVNPAMTFTAKGIQLGDSASF